jgi:cell division protein FtsL|tara:strand:- start:256 stop:411 length:156 start_codon:yes stop_codon:yes gene_type:complete
MIKTILIIVISVTIFGVAFFIIVRNSLKRQLDIIVENEKQIKEKKKLNNSK